MVFNSPESPSKKRKQPTSMAHLNRDQPLFASRRPAPTLQQPPDFLTDSLNTSYIPSPSPEKSPTRPSLRAKPREATNRKSLTAAFKATANSNDENKPPSFISRIPATKSRKPRSTSATGHNTAQAADKNPISPVHGKAPTPTRGRQVRSLTSPAHSESSPAHGYAEAYQRIVEEENLAQEGSIDDVDMDSFDHPHIDQSQDLHQRRLQQRENSASPVSLKASRRASPRNHVYTKPGEDETNNKENIANDAGSEADNSHQEDLTNSSLESGSSQYAKDQQRLEGALRSRPKAFSKTHLGERVGLTVENLKRRNGSNESLRSTQSAESFSHRDSDLGVNVPKAWGRKARPGTDWLSRINSRSGRFTGDVSKRLSSGEQMTGDTQKRDRSENIDEWIAAAAEVPLPRGEIGSSLSSSLRSTPIGMAQQDTSLDRRYDWQMDDDFTGRSLQVSESPPIRLRDSTLDRLRDREIENLEKQAVTTSRLGELREKTSEEHMKKRLPNRSLPELPLEDAPAVQGTAQSTRQSEQPNGPSKTRSSEAEVPKPDPEDGLESAGDPIPDTPVVIYRTKSDSVIGSHEHSTKQVQASRGAARRPSHERKDSHDLLRRLAKAASESPSPDKDQARNEHHSPELKATVEQTPQVTKIAADRKTPVVTGAWIDQTMGEIPQAPAPNINLNTPFVTGAWVDTPLPTGGRGPPMPTPSDMEDHKELNNGRLGANDLIRKLSPNANVPRPQLRPQEPLNYTGPPLPNSALENIINNAKGSKAPLIQASSDSEEDPTLHLGESTIQSLEDMIANDTDFSTIIAPTPPSQESSAPSSDPSPESKPVSTTDPKTSRLADPQSYTRILSRLTSLAPSLRDSKKQISSLERAMAKASPPSVSQDLAAQDKCDEAGEFHDFIWPCQKCGCPGRMEPDFDGLLSIRDNLTSIRVPVPRLWRWRQGDRRPHLTRLGVLTLVAWAMVGAEAWARARYCHPLYATSMVGYGVDIHAPRPPFVLFQVIYRNTGLGNILAPFYHLSRIVFKLLASIFGYLVGFMFGNEDGFQETPQPVSRDRRIPKPSWGPDLSMMDDEYL
ncbi:MAG: hypothetical protein Q9217_001029 [Psora testacea]